MALTKASLTATIAYTDSRTPVAGARAIVDNDSQALSVTFDTSTYNNRLRARYTIAGSGTQLIDLASFLNADSGATVTLTKAAGFIITGTQAYSLGPNNAANPLPWIWGGNTQTVTFGANEGMVANKAVTFTTGSKLLLTNTSGVSGTYDVTIIGGT